MGKSKTIYNLKWENDYKFLSQGPSVYEAKCKDCNSGFSIKSGGKADIERHCKTKKHKLLCNKSVGSISNSVIDEADENNNDVKLSLEEVMKAEILQALKVVNSNYSFNSTCDDGERFRLMFPNDPVAQKYHQSTTKVNYTIKHGISPYIKEMNIYDLKGSPFCFKFDETTTLQVKKQYDGYVQYWSKEQNLVVSMYCGSLFVGHCFSKDLLDHFSKFGEEMQWEPDLLLQLGMDGPNVNLKFEKDLLDKIVEEYGVSFLTTGTCSLHKTHNGFRQGILEFGFDIETFVNDTNFFLKLSAARRQDYKLMEIFTEIESKYMLKHVSSRWLSIKRPLLRALEQWENQNEYFLKFLPKQSNFDKNIKNSARYKRIVEFLKHPTSKASLCFLAFIAHEFEEYLIEMQANEPLIHVMYEKMSSLIYNLMKKFLTRSSITETVEGKIRAKQGTNLISVDLSKNLMDLDSIDIGSRAKTLISNVSKENKKAFQKKCLSFYLTTVQYLVSKLPIACKILKDAQYLHPNKRNCSASLNAIDRLCHKVTSTLKNHLQTVFDVSESTSVSEVCDMVRNQWQVYQLLDIPKEYHTVETESAKSSRLHQESYWKNVEMSWLDITPKESEEKSLRIDSYWSRVFNMKDSNGRNRFPQLAPFVKAILTLSHGNAGPEQGFSINKAIIDAHGTRIGEDVIVALRRTKHRLLQVGGVTKFKITRPLLQSVKLSRSRYEEELREKEKAKSERMDKEILSKNAIKDIDSEIKKIQMGIEVADKAISDGSKKLQVHLIARKLDPEKLQKDNSLIQMGLQRKEKLNEDLSHLINKKKAKLM